MELLKAWSARSIPQGVFILSLCFQSTNTLGIDFLSLLDFINCIVFA